MNPNKINQFTENQFLLKSLIFIVSFVFYLNTIPNKYALDDAIVISKNDFTRQGISGIGKIFTNDSFTGFFGIDKKLVTGGRYRPLSIATFAVEYEIFGLNPHISHFINILLYAFTSLLIFLIFQKLPIQDSRLVGFLAALIFAIHPVHSEVVANIKGRDEILSLLFSLLAAYSTLKFLDKKHYLWPVLAGFFLFLGLLSKESAISFLVIIPVTLFYFFPKTNIKLWLITSLPLILFVTIYVIIRFSVIGFDTYEPSELMNNPFLGATNSEKYGTIFYTLLLYLKLLLFPHPLTYDYYPYQIPLIPLGDIRSLLSIFFYLTLFSLILIGLKKKKIYSYGLVVYLVPLLIISNIIFPVGTFMNERFLYFSSLGFCLIVAAYIAKGILNQKTKKAVLAIFFFLIVLSAGKTIIRNTVWYDDYTLFTTDVKTSKNSAKSNCTAGGAIFEKAQTITDSIQKAKLLDQSISYLERSLSIYPQYIDAMLLLGNTYWERDNDYKKTWEQYSKILQKNPNHENVLSNLKIIAGQIENIQTKHMVYINLEKHLPNDYDVLYNLGHIKGRYYQQLDSSIVYLKKAVNVNPKGKEALKDLGVAYGIKGNLENSLFYFDKALAQDTSDKQLYINIGVTYQRLGNITKANDFFKKAEQLNQD